MDNAVLAHLPYATRVYPELSGLAA